MKRIEKKKREKRPRKKLSGLFNNRAFVAGFALVTAIVVWSAVAFSKGTEIDLTLDVPIDLNSASIYANYGLDVMNSDIQKVQVVVRGQRSVVGRLKADSILVTPVYINVTAAGTYELSLAGDKINSPENFSIVSINPSTVTLRLDAPYSKRFAVDTTGIVATAAEGYFIDTIATDPLEISVVGSEENINRISRVAVEYRFSRTLNKSERLRAQEIHLYDQYGDKLSKENLRMSAQNVDITIPVYKLGQLSLDIGFTNVPEGFDVSTLKYTLSVSRIDVAGAEETINGMRQPFIVGYVDLTTFAVDKEYVFEVTLPGGMVNRGSNTVTVTFSKGNIATKQINVTDIRAVNLPTNYNINIVDTVIRNVVVIGAAGDVDRLLATSVVAVIDFSAVSQIERGKYTMPVTFQITSNHSTWVIGSYTVMVEVNIS